MTNLQNILKSTVRYFIPSGPDIVRRVLREELRGCRNVLDLGCGERSPLRLIKDNPAYAGLYSVGVDIFSPYIMKNLEGQRIHSEYINQNIFEIDFPEKSFDCALLLDVIEHFTREDFLAFLPKLEKIAKKIIIITPNGFNEQDSYDDNPYQKHLSGWTVDDFEKLGFSCRGMSGLKSFSTFYGRLKRKPYLLGVLISDITQLFLYNKPRQAFHLIAIKRT